MLDLFDQSIRTADVEAAVAQLATTSETGRGAVFTKPDVVEAILDLCGYTADQPLHRKMLLEPSFGAGDFLIPAIRRLFIAFLREDGDIADAHLGLKDAIRAVELHSSTFKQTRTLVHDTLLGLGLTEHGASLLCGAWLICDDFLLSELDGPFDFVIGNPPYVRQERIPDALLKEYRRRYQTLYDRADLYIPFFERALDLLSVSGVVGYICANRWLKNRYGGPLREKISSGYWLKYFIDMEAMDAFHSDVTAYPAITVIQRIAGSAGLTRTVSGAAMANRSLTIAVSALLTKNSDELAVEGFFSPTNSSAPLLLDDIPRMALLRRIERDFPSLEQSACHVGIGVATGCDRVYIDQLDALPVEAERKLPLVMARDLIDGKITWSGNGVLNPFDECGKLVSLGAFPRFAHYLQAHREAIRGRNVAKRDQTGWYRTIDKIQPGLLQMPKILVPDIKGEGVFVIDDGAFYPHHNLYYITSSEWDLRALHTVLRSSLTLLTISTYCTRMAGGFLRFQAQYLRRIRLPRWCNVPEALRIDLIAASGSRCQDDLDTPVNTLYGLGPDDAVCARNIADAARVRKASP
ncbi:MAG TPA: Eco57I restriction-modification methylase domain-containing protein [Xanthomonadaceae bacterium]|jgi:hypothetical protein